MNTTVHAWKRITEFVRTAGMSWVERANNDPCRPSGPADRARNGSRP